MKGGESCLNSPGRRASDGGGFPVHLLNSNLPWPVQVALFLLFWLGPCVIVAGVFMAMWAGWIPSPITQTRDTVALINNKFDDAMGRMGKEVQNNRVTDEQVVRLLWATCRNVSRTDVERVQCDSYWRGGNGK